MRLALGTVQFGMDYGIGSVSGRVVISEIQEILALAKRSGIDSLDSASAYGKSEEVLGACGVDTFNVITKVPHFTERGHKLMDWVVRAAEESLSKLKIDQLHGLLIHSPQDLMSGSGSEVYAGLERLKEQGKVRNIGLSIYEPSDLYDLPNDYQFDIVQAPMNILDRRLEASGWLSMLRSRGTEVHVRSAFLQGLLIMPKNERPEYFKPWESIIGNFDLWLGRENLSPVAACIGFLRQYEQITKIIVGVQNAAQLQEIVNAMDSPGLMVPGELSTDELGLIDPRCWKT